MDLERAFKVTPTVKARRWEARLVAEAAPSPGRSVGGTEQAVRDIRPARHARREQPACEEGRGDVLCLRGDAAATSFSSWPSSPKTRSLSR